MTTGERVRLIKTENDVPAGTLGSVVHDRQTGCVFVIWDTGQFRPSAINNLSKI